MKCWLNATLALNGLNDTANHESNLCADFWHDRISCRTFQLAVLASSIAQDKSSKRNLPKEPWQLNIPPACITRVAFTGDDVCAFAREPRSSMHNRPFAVYPAWSIAITSEITPVSLTLVVHLPMRVSCCVWMPLDSLARIEIE